MDRNCYQVWMKPGILMIKPDHNMRNLTYFLILEKLIKGLFRVLVISLIEATIRPKGTAIDNALI